VFTDQLRDHVGVVLQKIAAMNCLRMAQSHYRQAVWVNFPRHMEGDATCEVIQRQGGGANPVKAADQDDLLLELLELQLTNRCVRCWRLMLRTG